MEKNKLSIFKSTSDSYSAILEDLNENKLSELERQELIRSLCQDKYYCCDFIKNDLYKSDSEFNFAKNFLFKYHMYQAIYLYYDEEFKSKLTDEDKKIILISGLENSDYASLMLRYEKDPEVRKLLIDNCFNDNSSLLYDLSRLSNDDLDYIYDKLYEAGEISSIPFNYMPQGSKLRKHVFIEKITDEKFVNSVINGCYNCLHPDEYEIFHDLYHEEMFKYAKRGSSRLEDYLKIFGKYLFDYEAKYLIKKELDSYSKHSLQRLIDKIYISENSFKMINTFMVTKKMSEGFGGN